MYRSNHRKGARQRRLLSRTEIHLFCAHSSDLYMRQRPNVQRGGRRSFLTRPPTPTARTHTCTNTQQWYSGQTVWARTQSAASKTGSLSRWRSVRQSPPKQQSWIQECGDGACVCLLFLSLSLFFFFFFLIPQGAKHLLIHRATWILSF